MIAELLTPWNRKEIQVGVQINRMLIKKGFTWEDVDNWIKNSIPKGVSPRVKFPVKKCPVCDKVMRLYPVNDTPESQVGGDLKSQWLCGTSCSGKGCGYEKFSKLSIDEEMQLLMENKNG